MQCRSFLRTLQGAPVESQGELRKEVLNKITAALLDKNNGDKSRAGGVDAPIADLVALLNAWPNIFTTSSCSGRVSVFAEPTDATRAAGKKGGEWIYVTHGIADADEIISLVQSGCSNGAPLIFRFEPFILAAEARTAADAQHLIRCARDAGYRESGVTGDESSRVIAGIRCSIRLEVPLTDGKQLLVPPEYLRHLTSLANDKMQLNWARAERFRALFRQQFLAQGPPVAHFGIQKSVQGGAVAHEMPHPNGVSGDGSHTRPLVTAVAGEEAAGLRAEPETKPGEDLERLNALRSRQCAILEQLGKLRQDQKELSAPVTSPGPVWRTAPLYAHGIPPAAIRRWGHSMVPLGSKLVIFGGYGGAGAHRRMADVLVYDVPSGTVRQLPISGPGPPVRMSHVAATLSASMLVHGGRAAPDQALGDLWLLDLSAKRSSSAAHVGREASAQWVCVDAEGIPPAPRHRHSAVSVGGSLKSGRIVIFGGMGAGNVLEDVWELRLRGKRWHWGELTCTGAVPGPRHSHAAAVSSNTMYVYGGVRDCGQAIVGSMHALDLGSLFWRLITFDSSIPRPPPLFSHTLTAVGRDRLVLIGGCPEQDPGEVYMFQVQSQSWMLTTAAAEAGCRPVPEAKGFKDALKSAEGLNRKNHSLVCDGGASIALPVTDACAKNLLSATGQGQGIIRNGKELGSPRMIAEAIAEGRLKVCRMPLAGAKVLRSPGERLVQTAHQLLSMAGVTSARVDELLVEVPRKWERLGDLVLVPADSFRAPEWAALGQALWTAVSAALSTDRLARQAPVANTGTRDSQAVLLEGADGWTRHLEGGVAYSLDVTRCMFSSGNVTERARMGRLPCTKETIVDLFAGIGYYTLPLLVHARAAKVTACEWNPAAVEALRRNLLDNHCADKCEVLHGDCRQLAPQGVADRVLLGLLPSSRDGWRASLGALRPTTGGWLHLHHNVKDSEEAAWIANTQAELERLSQELGREWRVLVRHVERVKWYAPHIRHLVLDVECRPDKASAQQLLSSESPVMTAPCMDDGADEKLTAPPPTQIPVPQGSGAVAVYSNMTREGFAHVTAVKEPAVLKGLDLGPAVDRWSGAYLKSLPTSSTTLVSVHVCPDPSGRLDFVHKNFKFHTMPLAELVGRCESPGEFPPLIAPDERYYLRSIGTNPRKEPSDIAAAFPDLAADLKVPQLFPSDRLFSSVLRISSGGLRLWTHFDVMDNLLCQIRGTKRIRLWPPLEEAKLYMTGSSSEVTDIDRPDPAKYPLFTSAAYVDCMLHPGDVLDPPAAEAAAAAVEAAGKVLSQLPPHYLTFYGQRCLRQLAATAGFKGRFV
ncbi:hypothetical protein WJX75_007384 [Coccomyxa subellipsoidea]|uniref:SAM-dependent methyltransferase TRM5/TYW2-type domain-containing protein n=1 Tax=Coccomyxa subellipsoidea TaxID=248742 RepID=A0ABR2YYU4_9CHLO